MSVNERGLGRGLDALFRNAPSETPGVVQAFSGSAKTQTPEITTLPIAALSPGQGQPRKHFDEVALDELAASIRSQGIVQPLLVRPHRTETATIYEIVAGERRWRAAQRAGLTEVPVYLRELSDEDALTVALIENLQREDLNALEEAQAIQSLRDRLPISQEELATRLGKSRSAVANALRLLQLPPVMQDALRSVHFTPGHARAILALPESELQERLFTAIMERHLSVRDAESAVVHWKRNGTLPVAINADTAPTVKTSRATKPESIKLVIRQLRETVHPKATIAGTDNMGRITLPYESEEQLAGILQRLGLDVQLETPREVPPEETTPVAEPIQRAFTAVTIIETEPTRTDLTETSLEETPSEERVSREIDGANGNVSREIDGANGNVSREMDGANGNVSRETDMAPVPDTLDVTTKNDSER